MRAILATLMLRPRSREEDPDAALFAAAEALARADREQKALWEQALGRGDTPFIDPEVTAATARLHDCGHRFARTPARSVRGLALKLRHVVADLTDGRTAWAGDLARGALADAERMAERG